MPRRKKPKMLGDRRGKNPNSLKNLRPMKPGETLNPTGINAKTPMTDEYRKCAADPIPESIREKLNARIGEEVLEPGDTWARANALRRFIDAVMGEGGVRSSAEIREAIEGIAPHRIEIAAGGPVSANWPSIVLIPVKSRYLENDQPELLPGIKTLEAAKLPPTETNGNGNG
jgi:hypothetical protein